MSTTEDQPAIGSPEWHRAQPPRVHTRGDLEFKRQQVWTDDDTGLTYAQISLGAVNLTFLSPQHIRDLIGRLGVLAGEMDAEITRHVRELLPQTTLHQTCSRCGAANTPLVPINDEGDLRCYESHRCADRVAARDAEAAQVAP